MGNLRGVPRGRTGRIENSLLRAPAWDAHARAMPDPAPLTARSLLGADHKVHVSRRLSMRDLAVLAATSELLPPRERPEVATTLYELSHAVYGRDGGHQVELILDSFDRLGEITLRLPGFDATRGRVVGNLAGHTRAANLLQAVFVDHRELRGMTAAQYGALKGTGNLRVLFTEWFAAQIRAGHATYLDLELFRALGNGLAARLWAFLEGERYEPKGERGGEQREAKAIGLGAPVVAALDLASYGRLRDARRKLGRAGERIMLEDPRYEAVEVRPSSLGYDLYVVRRRLPQRTLAERRAVRRQLRFEWGT